MLLAAKTLVISRLLHSKLSRRESPLPYLETLRNRLATLRRKLLARIDRRFKAADASKDALVEAMCAFALATSSSLTDVVRHFHHLRLEAMAECMDKDSERQDAMLQALRFYVKTLRDTQALVPGQLAHALERLKMVPIFKSQDLYKMMELNLDVHERWIGDDIKTFTPYVRHDDLSRAESERLLKQWARKAVLNFLDGLKSRIENVEDPVRLAKLRKEVLELWLSQHQHSRGMDTAETLDGLRNVFNDQAISTIREKVSGLKGVGTSIRRIVEDWREGENETTTSLWDHSMMSMDIANGGKKFSDSVADRLQGKNEPLRTVSIEYTQWLDGISRIENTIKSLRETKWDTVTDDVEEEDELLDNKQVLLSEDDPQTLQNELASALTEAYTRLEASLEPDGLFPGESKQGPKAVFFLRVWRELRRRLPRSYHNPDLGLDSLSKLTKCVIESAIEAPLRSCWNRLERAAKGGGLIAKPLWEGSPELPVLPSPWAYRLLIEVMQSMTRLGADVWSPHLSGELRTGLCTGLNDVLRRSAMIAEVPTKAPAPKVNGHANGVANGEERKVNEQSAVEDETKGVTHENGGKDMASDVNPEGTYLNGDGGVGTEDDDRNARDKKVQCLFDVLYLAHPCSASLRDETNGEDLKEIQVSLETKLKLEDKSLERMRKDAGEYWKRTKLLFALLQG